MLRLLTVAVLIASLTGAAPAAQAGHPVTDLIATIESIGVPVFTDHQLCDDGKFLGVYNVRSNQMLICSKGIPPQQWSAEMRDTLRHEAVHLIQDCHADGLRGPNIKRIIDDEQLGSAIARSGIDTDRIVEVYTANGADDRTIWLEMEAWSLAPISSEAQVMEAIRTVCRK